MDKYTVDLDQVLNDFEYLELTDGQTKNASNRPPPPHNNIPFPPPPPVTKHSITNVFHSLDQYLNSTINTGSTTTTTVDDNRGNNISNTVIEYASSSTNGENGQINNLLHNDETISDNINVDLTKTESLGYPTLADCTDDDDDDDDTDDVEVSLHSNNCDSQTELLINVNESIDSEENICLFDEIKNCDNTIGNDTEGILVDLQIDDIAKDTNVVEEAALDGQLEKEEHHTVEVTDIQEETKPEPEQLVAVETIVESQEISVEPSVIPEESTIEIVGFSNHIDIDENELQKMLEELEEEQEVHNGTTEQENGTQAEKLVIEDIPSHDVQEVNGYSETQPPVEGVKELEVQPIECLELEKPKKVKSVPIETVSPLVEEVSKAVPHERPQNLPLNNQPNEDSAGRKINLIGSPGSTPYNNVYASKSIEPKPAASQDAEVEYTSSASPTFSDCTSDSGSSTASTASVEGIHNNKLGQHEEVQDEQAVIDGQSETVENSQVAEDTEAAVSAELPSNPGNELPSVELPNLQSSGDAQRAIWLGIEPPFWVPDESAAFCLHCETKFTVLKRRHHCRACGLVLCSKCCNSKAHLEYLRADARVCSKCFSILSGNIPNNASTSHSSLESTGSPSFRPNPNNPLEYCSTVSPLQQTSQIGAPPPSVMVPVGVLKRKGSQKKTNKSVMFCDGIAPGSDLTHLDQDFNYSSPSGSRKATKGSGDGATTSEKSSGQSVPVKINRNRPSSDPDTGCFIPNVENGLPPTVNVNKTDVLYSECSNSSSVVEILKNQQLTFAIAPNLYVHVKLIEMNCCINKRAWCFSTEGLVNVGSDEVLYLIESSVDETTVPKDIFLHIYTVFQDAVKGNAVKELGISLHSKGNFLDSRNHAGFVYIKPTFQCLENIIIPQEAYVVGILIHRWEIPWAKLFPLRLLLRLGAEYRYYPSPLISTRHRDSVFVEVGTTIINLLADFRNFSYTLPQIPGLIIHMEEKRTTVTIPKNRYDQIMKSLNNSSDHILAFAGNFSSEADSHLVCIQNTEGHDNNYTTHAINIQNKPRKITGASFIVFNGSLKSSSGLTAKSNIVEDGLMIQVPSEHMDKIRDDFRNMKNHTIACGCIDAESDESVNIVWGENDTDFNVGVKSPVDLADMKGVPSIRAHNGKDHLGGLRLIRWTEVFILQNAEENPRNQDPVDISKISESIAKACCSALVKYLDLLVTNNCQKIGIRVNLQVDNAWYSAGSNGTKLAPIYMLSLDNELIPVLHRISSNNFGDSVVVLELIFRILNA